MRRSHRARLWYMGILILIYTCIQVYSQKINVIQDESPPLEDTDIPTTLPTILGLSSFPSEIFEEFTTNSTEETFEFTTNFTYKKYHAVPTWRPRRENCTSPAIEQFPNPLIDLRTRRHGGLIIHILVAVYTFFGLAIVCKDYFVATLDRICKELKLSPDVAGATLMAAGSSAPELATVIIGVFFAKDDIGISGVFGSAIFNSMFVISVCAFCSGTVVQLNWWPLVRDCFFYCISILVMLIIIFNDVISWMESFVMLLLYIVYCVTLHFNTPLEKWILSLNCPIKLPKKEEQSTLVTYKNLPDISYNKQGNQAVISLSQDPQQQQQQQQPDYHSYRNPNCSWDPNATSQDSNLQQSVQNTMWIDSNNSTTNQQPDSDDWGMSACNQDQGQQNYGYNSGVSDQIEQQKTSQEDGNATPRSQVDQLPVQPEYYKSKDPKTLVLINPLEKPVDRGIFGQLAWIVVYPIHYMCRLTMPDCRTEKYRNWYPFSFFISIIWISFYAYFMVWMITIIGTTLNIPDSLMAFTFFAAGVSVPDALSSIAVVKKGYGDMAVSNAIGSNIFDILVCLGLPWFIQTAIIAPGSHVNVLSKGFAYSTLSFLSTVVFLLLSTHLNGWKLDRRLGIILMIYYLSFITLASLYELNIFGQHHFPECQKMLSCRFRREVKRKGSAEEETKDVF